MEDNIKKELEKKHNIKIHFKNNKRGWIDVDAIAAAAIGFGIAIGIAGFSVCIGYVIRPDANVITATAEYSFDDIYAVYNVDKVWFCTRKLVRFNEETGHDVSGNYVYRDDIYDYTDIKTGEKICQSHDEGFFIEPINDIYSTHHDVSYNELKNEVTLDELLSSEPSKQRVR